MARLLLLLALLAFLSGLLFGAGPRRTAQDEGALPATLGYADVIGEGAGAN